jgi:hypothetical protein
LAFSKLDKSSRFSIYFRDFAYRHYTRCPAGRKAKKEAQWLPLCPLAKRGAVHSHVSQCGWRGNILGMRQLVIGGQEREQVMITVVGWERPAATDFWDGNWLSTQVNIQMGGWRGRYKATLRAEEFKAFREQLVNLYTSLCGEARFETMEEQLFLLLRPGKRGHIVVKGEARDAAGIGSKLEFTLPDLDQTYLPGIIQQLLDIEREYPVRGLPCG